MTFNETLERDKNKKALFYTVIVLASVLLLLFMVSWTVKPPAPPPPYTDLIEINLGNNEEGFGEEQPLVKGEPGPALTEIQPIPAQPAPAPNEVDAIEPDDNADEAAAAVEKVVVPVKKPKAPVVAPTPKKAVATNPAPAKEVVKAPVPQRPKLTYNGQGSGTGNNPTEDNGFTSQGNRPGGVGDAGDPSGNKDSYGNSPGGRVGGPKVIRGSRKVIRYYSFTGDLPKATIYAIVKVSPSGRGTFAGFDKGSTSRSQSYASAISNYLTRMEFDKAASESTVTVQFNFTVN